MYQVNIQEAKVNLARLIRKVLDGEEVVIANNNKPLVKLVKFSSTKVSHKLKTTKKDNQTDQGFDEPLLNFGSK